MRADRWMRQALPVPRGWFVGMGCWGLAQIVPWHTFGGALIFAAGFLVWRYRGPVDGKVEE